MNLLQPQDRRSKTPGDAKETILARARLLDAGHGAPLLDALALALPNAPRQLVDLGCGTGHYLAALQAANGCDAVGVDISVHAIDLAARRNPACTWIVANADRRWPFADGSVHVATAITGRTNAAELARVLAPDGVFLVAVPARDDQAELRELLYGQALDMDRFSKVAAVLAPAFRLETHGTVRYRISLDRAGLSDLLLGTYRGARHRERARIAEIRALDVTHSFELATFARRSDILTRSPSTESLP